MNQNLEILLVEDNDNFAAKATEAFSEHKVERAKTFLEAKEMMSKKDYALYLIDGFFPYGAKVPESISKEMFSVEGAFEKMPFEEYLEVLLEGKDGILPMGALVARELKQKGIENYLICSAADHHSHSYQSLVALAEAWNLKLNMADEAGKTTNSKSTPEYWQGVREKTKR